MPSRGSSSRPRSDSHQRSQQQQQYHQNSQPTSSSGKSNNNNGMYLIPVNGTGSSNSSGINHDQSNHHFHHHGSSSSQGRRPSTGDHHHQVQQQKQQQQGIYQGGLSYPPNSRSNSNGRGGSGGGSGTTPRSHQTPSAFSVPGQNSTLNHPSVDSSNSGLALRVLENDGNSSPSSRHRGGVSHGHGTPSSQPSLSIIPQPHMSNGHNTRERRPNSRDEGHPQPEEEEEEEDYYSSDELSSDLDEKEEEGEVDGGEEVCSFNTMLTAFACGLPFALSLIATGCITFLVENDPAKAILALSLQLILLCSGCGIYLKLRKFEKDSTDRQKERDKRRKQLNSRRKEIESKRKERERQTVANRAATTKGSKSTIGASTSATNSLTVTMTNPAPAQPQYFHRGFVRDFMDKSRKRERDLRGQWDMAVLQHRVDVRNVSFGGGGGTRESSTSTSTSRAAALLGGTETGSGMMTASSESLATRLLQGASGSYDALQDFIPFDERVCPFASASAVLFRHVTESSLTITSSAARPCLVVGATEFTMRLDPNQKFLGYPLTGKQVVNVSNCHSALKKSEFANRYLLPFSVFSGFDQQWLLLAQPASVNLCSLSEIVSGAAARQGKKSGKPGLHWALSVLRQIILVVCRSLHLHGIAHRKLSLKSILVPADTFNPSGLTLGDIDSLALYPLEDLEIVCEEAAAGMSSGGPTSSGGAAGSFGPTAGGTFSSLQGGAYGSSSMPTLRGHPMLYSAGILRDVCAIGSLASDLVKPYLERDTSVPGPMKEIVSQHLDSFLNLAKKFKKKRKCRAELFLLHPLLEIQAQLKPKTS